ncbi:MAG: hypothetical protein M0Q88_00255 [Bacilli bacterium]|nr:hypothetical protein [Bacilli bacterium]
MIEKIIFGGIYEHNSNLEKYLPRYYERLNDQKQGYWFPVRVVKEDGSDDIYMVDTYQFEMPYEYQKDYDKMVEFLKSLGEPTNNSHYPNSYYANMPFDYYYSARVLITESSIEAFDLLVNLEDCIVVREEEARYYDKEDVFRRVKFWNYHNSRNGVILKKKSAKLNYELKIMNLINDALSNRGINAIYDYYVDNVLECVKDANESSSYYDKNRVEYLLKLKKYLDRVSKNYYIYEKKIREELGL